MSPLLAGMGGTYVLHWALFTQGSLQARVLCALVPFTATLVFALVGLGLVPLDVLVKTATVSLLAMQACWCG